LWKEFNDHFKAKSRDRGKQINHHDFLDASFVRKGKESRKAFFSGVGGKSFDKDPYGSVPKIPFAPAAEAHVDLGRDRLVQTRKNYMNMQQNCFEVSLNKEKATIPKWLQQKLKAEGQSSLKPRIYDMHKTNPSALRKGPDSRMDGGQKKSAGAR